MLSSVDIFPPNSYITLEGTSGAFLQVLGPEAHHEW
jgi:hypothetical protein